MTRRAPSLPAGSAEVLAALASAGPVGWTMANLQAMTRLPVGRLTAVLTDCAGSGWVQREATGDTAVRYTLADGVPWSEHQRNSAVWATGDAVREPALLAVSLAAVEFAVRGLPFLSADCYRAELRGCLAVLPPVAQPWHALSVAIQGRRALRRWSGVPGTPLRHHRHVFTVRFDESSSFGRCYQECEICGAFRNTLFGDRIVRRQPSAA
jgi:hypothetical protein